MRRLFQAIALLAAILACPAMARPATPLILISIDGFRADYLDRGISPTLSALAADGVRAARMIPSYPSVTFPNHTTLVTGLYPDHNGIVNNAFIDPAMRGPFSMASHEEGWWGESTPIWISAERAGIHTGVMFWPGVSVPHQGTRPGLFHDFDHQITPDARVDTVLGWMDLPADQRPGLALLYFEHVDGAGHAFGPDSPEVNRQIATIDAAVGRLVAGLKARGIAANLVIVSDHGMATVAPDHLRLLDDLIDLTAVKVRFGGTIVGVDIPATPAAEAQRAKLLSPHAHLQCWNKADVPADLHYGKNPRVPDVVCEVETGWLVISREEYDRGVAAHHGPERGAHGYDNHDPAMGALFIAQGPAFRSGLVVPPFPNVDVYPVMARVLGITPLPNDGHPQDLAGIFKP
jgi:ectonucleotide pyrophosphatase/phosphodiesterase family member 5